MAICEAAVDWLRKKGLSKAAKKAGRVAAEGLIGQMPAPKKGAMVEVNSETDFVARNDHFQGLVKMIADVALTTGADVEAIKAAKAGSMTIADAISSAIATIGENITLRRAAVLSVGQGVVGELHAQPDFRRARQDRRAGRARIVGQADELAALGRQVAMHIASANPIAIDAAGVDPAVVKREKDILADKFRQQGKPEAMIEKITESGLKTFYKEQTLLEQPFIFDDKKSVGQALKEAKARSVDRSRSRASCASRSARASRKQTSDFAAEVAAAGGTDLTIADCDSHRRPDGQARLPPRDREGVGRSVLRARTTSASTRRPSKRSSMIW